MATAMPEKGVAATRIWLVVAISMAVMLADQIMKIWVKTNFYMGEDLPDNKLVALEIHRKQRNGFRA